MYRLLSFVIKGLSHIPFPLLYIISDGMYYLLYYIIRYRRRVVRSNLVSSFPKKDIVEIKQIERGFYRFFTDNMLESVKMASMTKEEYGKRMKFTNIEDINRELRAGRSISLYLGHYGNWEWVSSMPLWLEHGATAAQIYHKLRNKNMDRLILENRQRMGAKCVDMRKTARYINEQASKSEVSIIGFIADQSPRKREAIHFVSFMNHSTPVLTGTEKITKRYRFEAWYLAMKRIKRGYYEAEFIRMHESPEELEDFQLTAIYFEMLQQAITSHPELYLWTHNRFKHAVAIDQQQ